LGAECCGILLGVRPPKEAEIYAPEFPSGLDWLNVAFLRMNTEVGRSAPGRAGRSRKTGRGAVLVEFWDFARINSLRTLPYLQEWHTRYADAGLRVIGVHTPAYSFGRDRDTVARAVERLEITYPVLLDPDFQTWREYGNKGWPGRYLFDRAGRLAHIHYGEGEYEDTERAIGECLGIEVEPMEPLRPEDAPGALLEAQTADIVLPAERERLELVRDWTDGEDWIAAADAGAAASFEFSAGVAYAALSGSDMEPGLYETDGTVEAESPGLRLHAIQFTPKTP
jgi:hypothetical protein